MNEQTLSTAQETFIKKVRDNIEQIALFKNSTKGYELVTKTNKYTKKEMSELNKIYNLIERTRSLLHSSRAYKIKGFSTGYSVMGLFWLSEEISRLIISNVYR